MDKLETLGHQPMPRRGFLTLAGAAALTPILGACSKSAAPSATSSGGTTSGGLPTGVLKYWAPLRGTSQFSAGTATLIKSYKDGGLTATYQVIPGANLFQTFQAAIAAKSGPAVSEGFAFQAFQFADEGAIAYADNLYETMKQNGMYDDFLPGVIEPFKTTKGYVAVPWGMDMRILWYRKSLLEKAGVAVPTDWPSLLAAGKALKKINVFSWGTAAGAGAAYGGHALVSLMINNGGGLFDEQGKIDCLYDRNVEAMDFLREMVSAGMVDAAAVSYTNQNFYDQWKNKRVGIGIVNANLPLEAGDTSGDLAPMSPLVGPHGDKGTLQYLNNFMMYTNTPSQKGSENFLIWWLKQFKGAKGFYAQNVTGGLPVFKSVVALPEIQSNKDELKILTDWQPVGKGYSARGTTLFAALAAVDAGTAINQFTQTMLAGKTDSKTALQTLESGIKSVMGG